MWIGLLSQNFEQCLDFLNVKPHELSGAFLTENGEHNVPSAEALQQVAGEKFSFLTAESGDPMPLDPNLRLSRVEEALRASSNPEACRDQGFFAADR